MKAWKAPVLEALEIKQTTAPVDITNMTSGQVDQLDLGTCNNPYWGGSWGK